ncbi:hypothetical protein RCG63_08840 [Lactococcus lactis]|uniref:hypothetical protein n=1 Tax=Lactococcus lactis TaxID=1358 RepID=UPI0027EDB954|nr:hypothetical protein [Lactococcus lactis]MDQ7160070.1 hypothetical protein [Lactococcus lactis]
MVEDALNRLQQIAKEAVIKEQAKIMASEMYKNEWTTRDIMILGKELVKIASKDIIDGSE